MSLLMEALKKAERAKQEKTELSGNPPAAEKPRDGEFPVLSLEPENPAGAAAKLPAASSMPPIAGQPAPAPLELTLVEPAPLPAAMPVTPPAAPHTDAPAAPRSTAQAPSAAAAEPDRKISATQQKAQAVFLSKQPPRNRRLPFLMAIAALLVSGLTGFGYYWNSINQNSGIAGSGLLPDKIPAPVPATSAATPAATPAVTAAIPDSSPTASSPVPLQTPIAVISAAKPAAAAQAPSAYAETHAIQVRQASNSNQTNPALSNAYQAFTAGDLETAQQQYRLVLQTEPNNRDALLGMAAIALHRKQGNQAGAYYARLLELDPADPDAVAGLVNLQTQADPVQNESRLKKILAQNPQAAVLHFTLGNQYTQQSRWADAQQSYFRAYSGAPDNADYAFNLAVSLDRLGQERLAIDYYQRALTLTQSGSANFDRTVIQKRIRELLSPAGH